jgi:methylglyoxal synthase
MKTIALVSHDNKKQELLDWCKFNKGTLEKFTLYATGTTGSLIEKNTGIKINKLLSGPLGGDQQLGAMIAQGQIDILIFFWDALEAHPHDPDIKALLRISVLYNIPTACNLSTADLLISSPLISGEYKRKVNKYVRNSKNEYVKIEE